MRANVLKKTGIWLFCLACAAAALLFASTASPLYATNFWTDTNLYFTIGRGLRAGRMPYRDLFDHKGPLFYLLYGAAACLSEGDFRGVFLLEVLSLAAFLRLAYGAAKRAGAHRLALAAPPAAAVAACCCRAFTQGGSAEEFCLPFLLLAVLAAHRLMAPPEEEPENEKGKTRLAGAVFGASAAFVFLVKFTDCGLFAGLGLFVLLSRGRRDGLRAALADAGAMLAGFLVPAALVFGVYAAGGALGDCLKVYFWENLTGYSGAPMTLRGHLWNALAYLRTQSEANPVLAALTAFGMAGWAAGFLRRGGRGALAAAAALPAGAGLLLLTCYWGEMAHPYYALVFAATAVPGLAALLSLPGRLIRGRSTGYLGIAAAAALAVAAAPLSSLHPEKKALRAVRREEMPQTIFAEEMKRRAGEEPVSVLDLTSLDQGFYLAAGVVPGVRYFADNNLNTEEKRAAIEGYLREAETAFVVTVWRDPGERYERVMEAEGLFDLADRRVYTLWQRKKTDLPEGNP